MAEKLCKGKQMSFSKTKYFDVIAGKSFFWKSLLVKKIADTFFLNFWYRLLLI